MNEETFDPARHLAFKTQEEAVAEEARICEWMGLGDGVTKHWDTARQCADGRWIITKPKGYEVAA